MRVLDTAVIEEEENGQNKPPTLNFPILVREVKRGRLILPVLFLLDHCCARTLITLVCTRCPEFLAMPRRD